MPTGDVAGRRGFLARIAGAATLLATGTLTPREAAEAQTAEHDRWLTGLTGRHRCLFDFPQHGDGLPLIHIYNYLNTYRTAYGVSGAAVNTVGTLYGSSERTSIPLGWNDAIWEKYQVGEILKLTDPKTGKPAVRNMFARPQEGDPILRNGTMLAAGIESLQRMGTVFIMCNNALNNWIGVLSARAQKPRAEVEAELRGNLLPGVTVVPAMVIAIEKAQGAGIAYNRQ